MMPQIELHPMTAMEFADYRVVALADNREGMPTGPWSTRDEARTREVQSVTPHQSKSASYPDMINYLVLGIALVLPAIFWRYGKRLLGSQTHPAALFIMAWMATALLLSSSGIVVGSAGIVALLWVLIGFGAMAVFDKFRRKPGTSTDDKPS